MKKKIIIFVLIALVLLNASILFAEIDSIEEKTISIAEELKTQDTGSRQASLTDGQIASLNSLFKAVKEKSKDIKPAKYEVTLPVAAAGARGAETRHQDRFAVIWPDSEISPITALVENMLSTAEQGGNQDDLKKQLKNFIKVFPEFKDHELLNDLNDLAGSGVTH